MTIQGFFIELLKQALQNNASDVHITAGTAIRMRLGGKLVPLGYPPLKPEDTVAIAHHILQQANRIPPGQADDFLRKMRDEDCAYSAPGVGRFRVNVCVQRGTVSMVLRAIPYNIPDFHSLGLPPVLAEIAMEERGLVLVTGITGSGKSTTLASVVSYINSQRPCKIVTIEDPIEFMYRDGIASLIQREVGSDTKSFADAMRAALRQDPDVILVGEMRDRETIDIAVKAAETGHLVFSTVHTTDAPKTLNRLMAVFDKNEQNMLRIRLADALKAIVSQRLLPRTDGKGRVPAVEIMRSTPTIKECILDPDKTHSVMDYIKAGKDQYGMQSFDQHLMALYDANQITLEVAKGAATSPAEFERNLVYV